MAKGWYVVHTYSGYENKVQKHITKLMGDGSLVDYVFNVKVPAEEVVEVRDGKRRVTSKKFLPGYIMVEMDLPERNWKQVFQPVFVRAEVVRGKLVELNVLRNDIAHMRELQPLDKEAFVAIVRQLFLTIQKSLSYR